MTELILQLQVRWESVECNLHEAMRMLAMHRWNPGECSQLIYRLYCINIDGGQTPQKQTYQRCRPSQYTEKACPLEGLGSEKGPIVG